MDRPEHEEHSRFRRGPRVNAPVIVLAALALAVALFSIAFVRFNSGARSGASFPSDSEAIEDIQIPGGRGVVYFRVDTLSLGTVDVLFLTMGDFERFESGFAPQDEASLMLLGVRGLSSSFWAKAESYVLVIANSASLSGHPDGSQIEVAYAVDVDSSSWAFQRPFFLDGATVFLFLGLTAGFVSASIVLLMASRLRSRPSTS